MLAAACFLKDYAQRYDLVDSQVQRMHDVEVDLPDVEARKVHQWRHALRLARLREPLRMREQSATVFGIKAEVGEQQPNRRP